MVFRVEGLESLSGLRFQGLGFSGLTVFVVVKVL